MLCVYELIFEATVQMKDHLGWGVTIRKYIIYIKTYIDIDIQGYVYI